MLTRSLLRSTRSNVGKYVGFPNWLTIAITLYKNCFQYADVPLTELIDENVFSHSANLLIVLLKLF